jgi:hypothetical protein
MIAIAATAAMLSIFGASAAQASVQLGKLWINDPNSGDASIIPAGSPDAEFATGAINYDSRVTDYTIGGFLNNPTFIDPSAAFTAAGGGSASADNIFLLLSGTIGLLSGNNSFVVEHDDGVVMNVAGFGNVVDMPGATAPSTTPFNVFNPGAAGNFDFTLQYTECCGPPAVLLLTINNVNPGIPEPATWAMMLVGFGGLGAALRSARRAKAVTA